MIEAFSDIRPPVLGFVEVGVDECADHDVSADLRVAGDEGISLGDTAYSASSFLLRELIL